MNITPITTVTGLTGHGGLPVAVNLIGCGRGDCPLPELPEPTVPVLDPDHNPAPLPGTDG